MHYLVAYSASLLLVLVCGFCSTTACVAQEAISEKTLSLLRNATVFVKVDLPRSGATGSGFLIKKEGDVGYVITNEHVVRSIRGHRNIEVIFNSGTSDSRTLKASVMGEDKSRDLAILKIKSSKLPKPISIVPPDKMRETVPVFILGFPFGEQLAAGDSGPAVTIGKGTISSFRRDKFNRLKAIQIDGDINPGNSGGPIVLSTGELVGVSVATVLGTQIGIAVPGNEISEMLLGRVSGVRLEQKRLSAGKVRLGFKADLVDPVGKLEKVSRIGSNPSRIEISSDSKYVALPSGGGNTRRGYITLVYRTADILDPVIKIEGGAYPRTLGFDKKARLIYAQNHSTALITFSTAGTKRKEYESKELGKSTKLFLVHPSGGNLLIMTEEKLSWAKLPVE